MTHDSLSTATRSLSTLSSIQPTPVPHQAAPLAVTSPLPRVPNAMTSTLTLIIYTITLLALLYLLLRLPPDTTLTPPRSITRALVGVAFVPYNGQNRALLQAEMGVLGQEPLRGYYRWWKFASEWSVPTVPDELSLKTQHPLGRQDTIAAVPAPAAPFVR